MIRTQVYIPEFMHLRVTRIADDMNEPMAKVVRNLIEIGLQKMEGVDHSGMSAIDRLLTLRATGGPADLSQNHDHYLYGGPKKSNN